MEERIVVLCRVALVVLAAASVVVADIIVVIIESICWETAFFHCLTESSCAHLAAAVRLLDYKVMFIVFGEADAFAFSAEGYALCCCSRGCVGYCEHGDYCADHDGGCSGCLSPTDERVALFVIRFHGDGRESEICAVDCYNGRLRKTCFGIVFLNRRVN